MEIKQSNISQDELQKRLDRAESMLRAIISGEVDAVVRDNEVALIRSESSVKHTENSLKSRELFIQSLIETTPNVIICLSPDLTVCEFNLESEKVYKIDRNKVIAKNYLNILVKESEHDMMKDLFKRTLRGEIIKNFETTVFESVILWNMSSIMDDTGLITGIIMVGQDITERKKQENTIWESQRNLQSLFDRLGDLLFVLDMSGCIIHFNPPVVERLGYPHEELIGKNILEIQAPERLESIAPFVADMLEGKTTLFPSPFVTIGGTLIQNETLVTKGRWNDNDVLFAISRDITERKKAEEELNELNLKLQKWNEDLESRVKERTLELEAQTKKLIELNATKDRFFSIISHDLRGAFTPLVGYTDVFMRLVQKNNNPALERIAQSVVNAVKNVHKLLEDLLNWGRIQRGDIAFAPKEISFAKTTMINMAFLSDNALEKQIKINNRIPSDLVVVADSDIVSTILRNLMSNAIKFTYPNGTVTISSEIIDKNFVKISVSDTGVGISDENLPKLFKIDQKFKGTGTSGEKGSGLGLILCKEFVEKNKGNISVKSKVGEGTIFSFTLPVNDSVYH